MKRADPLCRRPCWILAVLCAVIAPLLVTLPMASQQLSTTVLGTVTGSDGTHVAGAVVQLSAASSDVRLETVTDASGAFQFSHITAGQYKLTAAKGGLKGTLEHLSVKPDTLPQLLQIILHRATPTGDAPQDMQFSDEPNFTVAGVTDWTAVGGHGSDSTLRTSESLAVATATLPERSRIDLHETAAEVVLEQQVHDEEQHGNNAKAQELVHNALQSHASANLYRLAGEVDEKSGDPLTAVHEFELAAKLDPSELNEFEWGSELLLHRAILQAEEVFQHGVDSYPESVRMQTALGTALFASARYQDAATRLCRASDLAPADEEPYQFIGKVELAAPYALTCVEPHLQRYVQLKPKSAEASYLYAMAILKRQESAPDQQAIAQAETLLQQAVHLDARCSDGYLELGVLAAQRKDLPTAIAYYTKTISADPKMADAYYRLAKIYERTGESEKAKVAFATHEKLIEEQKAATEQQRRAVKQFLFAKPGDAPTVATP
jgi:tetratricopeptide (TPR) repeat protein